MGGPQFVLSVLQRAAADSVVEDRKIEEQIRKTSGARAAPKVVPRAMLLQHVWDLHFDPATNIIVRSMSAASDARLTVSRPIRSFIQFAASDIASVLLAKKALCPSSASKNMR
jgi:hypothetical protein